MNLSLVSEELLKKTTGRCTVCNSECPAEVWKVSEGKQARIFLKRTCSEHGSVSNCISSDARFYWLAQGDPGNACCGGGACSAGEGGVIGTLGRNAAAVPASGEETAADPFEKLATCLALIEIVHSCNLACPTCYADSPVGTGARVDAVPLEDLKQRIEGVIERKGGIELLQLSGGEPTLHPQFFELVEWATAHGKIDYLLLNTNGVRIATDDAFAERLGRTFRYGGMQLYLQFDGVQEEGQAFLRGGDLRAMRQKAIERCEAMNLPVTLAMTVTPDNLPHLWETIEFGLRFRHVRGVAFQPMFGSGRVPSPPQQRLNTADIILAAVDQSAGQLRYEDFTPLPCGDPNCATIGYLLKTPIGVRSISDFINFAEVQGFLRDKIRYSLNDLSQCGCDNQPLGDLLKKFEMDETHTFRLFIKPFMDAWSWDQDRIDRCCTHVITPEGKLDSFCRFYSGIK